MIQAYRKGGESMSRNAANLLFVLATFGWASSYLFTKFAVNELQPFMLVTLRFSLAFFITFILFYKRLVHVKMATLRASALLGALLCLMFTLFCIVLKTVNPSTAGFLLATSVVIVPFIAMFFTRKWPQRQIVIGAIVTFAGLCIFMFDRTMKIDGGVVLSLITAIFFAIHLVINNRLAQRHDALQLGVYQLGFAAIFGAICLFIFEPLQGPQTSLGWISVVVLAVVCSAFGFVVQSVVQQYTSAEQTGFILALEPIFAAIFAYIVLGDVLLGREWIGAIVIFIGVFIASYQPKLKPILAS